MKISVEILIEWLSYSVKHNLKMRVKEMQNTNFLLLQGALLLL